jgi:hypothetical protein
VVEAIVETEAVEQVDAATAVTSVGSSSALASGGKKRGASDGKSPTTRRTGPYDDDGEDDARTPALRDQ